MQQIENLEYVTRCWLVIRFAIGSHRDDLQESLLLLNGDGNAAGDGDRRHGIVHRRDGFRLQVFGDEKRGTDGL